MRPSRPWTIGAGGVETRRSRQGTWRSSNLDNEGKLSRRRRACAIGYQTAPVVIAVCEDFAGRDRTGRKYTVAVHPRGGKGRLPHRFRAILAADRLAWRRAGVQHQRDRAASWEAR